VTGRQRLRLQGKRVPNMESLPALKGSAQDLPPPGRYLSFSQGIYATGSTEIPGTAKIREGVCGSAVVRVRARGGGQSRDVLSDGEICGFMHWSDLQHQNETQGKLLCFADSVDELIKGGWQVVQVAEKRTAAAEDIEEPQTPKKQK
jgi:hypothetical protein